MRFAGLWSSYVHASMSSWTLTHPVFGCRCRAQVRACFIRAMSPMQVSITKWRPLHVRTLFYVGVASCVIVVIGMTALLLGDLLLILKLGSASMPNLQFISKSKEMSRSSKGLLNVNVSFARTRTWFVCHSSRCLRLLVL